MSTTTYVFVELLMSTTTYVFLELLMSTTTYVFVELLMSITTCFCRASYEYHNIRFCGTSNEYHSICFLSHLLVAGCDIGVRFSVRPSTFMSTFHIYVKVSILINYKTKQPSNLA